MRHDNTERPPTSTAQVPHSPSSQPCFVPVKFRSSRSTSSRVLCGAKATSVSSPLRVKRMCAFCLSVIFKTHEAAAHGSRKRLKACARLSVFLTWDEYAATDCAGVCAVTEEYSSFGFED